MAIRMLDDGMLEAGFSNAIPLQLDISSAPSDFAYTVDGLVHFSEEGAVLGSKSACSIMSSDNKFSWQGQVSGPSAPSFAHHHNRRMTGLLRNSTIRDNKATRRPLVLDHPDFAQLSVKFFFKKNTYWLRNFSGETAGEVYLKLKSKTMREAIKLHNGMTFVIGGLVCKVRRVRRSTTKVVWDGRRSRNPTEPSRRGAEHSQNSSAESFSISRSVSQPSPSTSSADITVDVQGEVASPSVTRKRGERSSSILKKKETPRHESPSRKKCVTFEVSSDAKTSQSEIDKQVVDEITESEALEIEIVKGPDGLKSREFKIVGEETITFGTQKGSTVMLPAESSDGKIRYSSEEAKIRLWASEYYLFTGRKRDVLVRIGRDAPFAIRPGDCFAFTGATSEPVLEFMATLAYDISPTDSLACHLHRKCLGDPICFEILGKDISLGTKNDVATIAIKDIKMASLHATIRKWRDTYYLDPESQTKGVYTLIGRAPSYSRGPLMLDVKDTFKIGRTEIQVVSISNTDQDPEQFSMEGDEFTGVKRRKSRMFQLSSESETSRSSEATGASARSSDVDFDSSKHKHRRSWSTRLSFVASGGGVNDDLESVRRSSSMDSISRKNSAAAHRNSSQIKEDWFGYAGNSENNVFSIQRSQLDRRCGGAFSVPGKISVKNKPTMTSADTSMLPKITLRVTMGPIRGHKFVVDQGIATIGRHPQNTIVIADRSVSAVHASICFRAGQFYLTDMNSKTGTFSRVFMDDGVALERGDVYLMGETEMSIYTKDFGTEREGAGCCSVS